MSKIDFSEDRVVVVDAPPGFGKTSLAIQQIRELPDDNKIIYITPFLSEVKRIIDSCPNKNFVQPNVRVGRGSKMNHLLYLVLHGKNIVSTHALFSNISDEMVNALRVNNYTLYLDEVFQTIENYSISNVTNRKDKDAVTKQDMTSLIAKGYVEIDDDYVVSWIDNENLLSKYEPLKKLADRKSLYYVNDSLLLWSFPTDVFREGIFNKIFIMTYNFDYQIQSSYYIYHGIEYVKYGVRYNELKKEYEPIEYDLVDELSWKNLIKNKIHILDNDKLNRIGDVYRKANNIPYKAALSLAWFENNPNLIRTLSDNIDNYYKHYAPVPANMRLWTTFKTFAKKVKSRNVSMRAWLPLNARATNDYAERTALCYAANRYVNPFIYQFFSKREVLLDQDKISATEMIQWIWRSAVRNGQEIQIYIPSKRMRTLLEKFLNNEEVVF